MDDTSRRLDDTADDRGPLGEDAETTQRAAAIREEIEQTREEMADTIDAIQDKLRPSTIVAGATERIKAATTEGARAMADTAGEMAQNAIHRTRETARDVMNRTRDTSEDVMNQTRHAAGGLMDTIRDNPFPAALIGVGLAWWAFTRFRDRNDTSWDDIRGESSGPYYGDNQYDNTREFDGGFDGGDGREFRRGADSAEGILDTAKQYASETTRAISGTTRAIGRTSRRASSQFGRVATENPLLMGAGALLVGAAFGLAVPETESERKWMGETRDAFVSRAQQAAGDAAEKVRSTATEVADAASQLADSVTGKRA